MPFHKCHVEDRRPVPDLLLGKPSPKLRQDTADSFTLLETFCYHAPASDPDHGTIFVVPAADLPNDSETRHHTVGEHEVVVPPNDEGHTDLASVPWFMWWLVASYGNHTRAALLHDALIVDPPVRPPVPRTTADRLFLNSLREADGKAGAFRHWLMWAAVSVFGTMRRRPWQPVLFCLHVLLLWASLITAVALSVGPHVWHSPWTVPRIIGATLLTLLAVFVFAFVMGLCWRSGIEIRGGWLAPAVPLLAICAVGAYFSWPDSGTWTLTFSLFIASAVLAVLGPVWGGAVDPTLKHWLWPTAVIGLPVAVLPLALIFAAVAVVLAVDVGAALAAARTRDERGRRRGFRWPTARPLFRPPI
jgi:Protein of unknown function (DUF1353)